MEKETKEYILSAVYKKSTCEEQDWCNTLKNGKGVMVKVSNVYRWGNFQIWLTDTEKEELLEMDEVRLDDYDHELIEMWDGGCDFWIETVGEEDYTDSEKEEIEYLLYRLKDVARYDEDIDDDNVDNNDDDKDDNDVDNDDNNGDIDDDNDDNE